MTSIPLVTHTNPADTSATSPSTSNQNTPSNTLGPNSFITLLTAQLQAQDPLSPMDPNQMVNELTSINTLQQIVQIRTDMDSLVSALSSGQGGGTGSGTGSGSGSGSGTTSSASPINSSAVKQHSQADFNSQSN